MTKHANVSFRYQENARDVLHDLCFEIRKGETIGIIGTSGAGKSTLVDLLIGLIDPWHGQVAIDGRNLDRTWVEKWLRITGYVPQSPYILTAPWRKTWHLAWTVQI